MSLLFSFLTDVDRVESVFQKVREAEFSGSFDKHVLMRCGIKESEAILLIKILYELAFLDEDYKPTHNFRAFVSSEEASRVVLARQMRKGFAPILKKEPMLYRHSRKKVRKIFKACLCDEKSDTFIRFIADAFYALARYAEWDYVEGKSGSPDFLQQEDKTKQDRGNEIFRDVMITENRETKSSHTSQSFAGLQKTEGQDEEEQSLTWPSSKSRNSNPIYIEKALTKRAALLKRLGRFEEAVSAYNDAIAFYEGKEGRISNQKRSDILMVKAGLLEKLERYDNALEIYDEVLDEYLPEDKSTLNYACSV